MASQASLTRKLGCSGPTAGFRGVRLVGFFWGGEGGFFLGLAAGLAGLFIPIGLRVYSVWADIIPHWANTR